MNNKEIYKKTLTFSIRRLLWDIASLVVMVALGVAGFLLTADILGLFIGVVVALIIIAIASHFISYVFKAGQIAMMTRGITEGSLPENVYEEGKKVVKERFVTVAVYYAATGAIKGIFNQIGRAITSLGEAVGGDAGETVGSAISAIIQTIINYLCDCCLGWVFYKKDQNAAKATLDGAVLFFKKGKTFLKNMGRVFGIGFLSFIVIGGIFFGVTYLISSAFSEVFNTISTAIVKNGEGDLEFFAEANNIMLVVAGIGGVVMWSILHSVFVRPFVLVGVLRNYIESNKDEQISEEDYAELDKKSSKFKKLHAENATN